MGWCAVGDVILCGLVWWLWSDDRQNFVFLTKIVLLHGQKPSLWCASSSVGSFTLAVVIGPPLPSPSSPQFFIVTIFASSPELNLVVLLCCRLRHRRLPPPVFALLFRRPQLRLTIAPVLLLPLPPLGAWSHRSTSSDDWFAATSVSADKDAVSRFLPGVFSGINSKAQLLKVQRLS